MVCRSSTSRSAAAWSPPASPRSPSARGRRCLPSTADVVAVILQGPLALARNSSCSFSGAAPDGPMGAAICAWRWRRMDQAIGRPSLSGDEDGAEVVHVGQGRAGDDLVAQGLEEAVPVVVGQARLGADPAPGG